MVTVGEPFRLKIIIVLFPISPLFWKGVSMSAAIFFYLPQLFFLFDFFKGRQALKFLFSLSLTEIPFKFPHYYVNN